MAQYKRIFLEGHSYYLTIVTHGRNPILVDNIELLRESFRESKRYFKYTIDAIVVLPDHIHMIITPQIAEDYSRIVKSIKYHFSKQCKLEEELEQSASRYRRKYRPIWQKRFYEHTIRDEKDYQIKLQYIYNNPVKHGLTDNIYNWKYGSLNFKPTPL